MADTKRKKRSGAAIPDGLCHAWMVLFVAALVMGSMAAWVETSQALDVSVMARSGYDSNPAETDGGEGSGFVASGLFLHHDIPVGESFVLGMAPAFEYQALNEFDDNYQFSAELSLTPRVPFGTAMPRLFIEAIAFRDSFIEEDERNEAALGAGVDWLLSERYTLSAEAALRRLDYLSGASPFFRVINPPYGHGAGFFGSGMGMTVQPPRDDTRIEMRVGIDIILLPELSTGLAINYARLDSSTDSESFQRISPEVQLVWQPADAWQIRLTGSLEMTSYDNLDLNTLKSDCGCTMQGKGPPDDKGLEEITYRKENQGVSAELHVSRFIEVSSSGSLEVFAQVMAKEGEYPLNDESYTRQVVQCGLSWSF